MKNLSEQKSSQSPTARAFPVNPVESLSARFSGTEADIIGAQASHLREIMWLSNAFVTEGEDCVLLFLGSGPAQGMLSGDIMGGTGLTTGRIANILRQLEAKGFVTRVQDVEDRRKVHVSLTETGRQECRRVCEALKARTKDLSDYLGNEDTALLHHLMQRCILYAKEKVV